MSSMPTRMNCSQRFFILFLSVNALCMTGIAIAEPQANAPKGPTQAAVERLSEIRVLPLPEWRTSDDSALHGEDPRLDDSGWSSMKVGGEWTTGPRWMRRWIEIPATLANYDIRNATVRLRTRINGENPVFVRIFLDGRLVAE